VTERIHIFFFPLYLVLIELVMRLSLKVDTYAFLGPTLAAVGIGFAIPLTIPKDITRTFAQSTQKVLKNHGAAVYSRRDYTFVVLVRIILLLFTAGWSYSLYLSVESPGKTLCYIPVSLGLGVLNYVVAIVLSVIKEII